MDHDLANKTDAVLRWMAQQADRRARTARGPSAAQSAARAAARYRAELQRRTMNDGPLATTREG